MHAVVVDGQDHVHHQGCWLCDVLCWAELGGCLQMPRICCLCLISHIRMHVRSLGKAGAAARARGRDAAERAQQPQDLQRCHARAGRARAVRLDCSCCERHCLAKMLASCRRDVPIMLRQLLVVLSQKRTAAAGGPCGSGDCCAALSCTHACTPAALCTPGGTSM